MAAFYRDNATGLCGRALHRGLLPIHLSHRRFTDGLETCQPPQPARAVPGSVLQPIRGYGCGSNQPLTVGYYRFAIAMPVLRRG